MRTSTAAFLGLDGDTFDGGAFFVCLNYGITNDDIGINIGEGILDFAHCCSSSFVVYGFAKSNIPQRGLQW